MASELVGNFVDHSLCVDVIKRGVSMNANGKTNGNGAQQGQTVEVNPVECARFALIFLARASFNASERQPFDLAEGLLRAIVAGQCVIAPPPQQALELPPPPPQPDAAQ